MSPNKLNTHKRKGDPMQDSNTENNSKALRLSSGQSSLEFVKIMEQIEQQRSFFTELIRESEDITSNVIKESIEQSEKKHFDFIKNMLKESETRILSEIDTKINSVKTEINSITERVNRLEKKSSETVQLKDEILDLKRKLLKQENSVVAGGIRIRGIPYRDNENLINIFSNICNSLKIVTPQIENIYRLNKIYKENKPYSPTDEVIVAKLQSPYDKNFLLRTIANYRRKNETSLRQKHAGYDSDEPIYVNENLTPHNHKIFQAALKLKKDGLIKATFTDRGLIYIRKHDSEEPVFIEFIDQLKQFFHQERNF